MSDDKKIEILNPADVLENPQNYTPKIIAQMKKELQKGAVGTLTEIAASNATITKEALESSKENSEEKDAEALELARKNLENNQ